MLQLAERRIRGGLNVCVWMGVGVVIGWRGPTGVSCPASHTGSRWGVEVLHTSIHLVMSRYRGVFVVS